jgi:protease 2
MNKPPMAERIEKDLSKFGKKRIDPYYWLKDKTNSKVIDYLKAENAYKDSVMASTKDLQKTLYDEMVARIKEDDESYPTFKNGYYYYNRTEKGKQYRTYCRKKSLDGKEEIILDANKMAEGKPAFIFWGYFVSPDNKKLAYLYNETGSYAEFTLKFLSLETGKEIGFAHEGVDSFAWSNDSEHVFYTEIDDTLRSSKFFKRALDGSGTELLYEEIDGKFRIGCYTDTARKYVILQSNSSTTSEVYYIKDCDYNGKLELFRKREHHFDYDILPYHDYFYVRCKDDDNLNGYICKVKAGDINDKSRWEVIIPTNKEELIEALYIIEGYLMVEKRRNGLINIFIFSTDSDEKWQISFPEPVYNVSFLGNPEFNSTTVRYNYSSLNRPTTLYEYDVKTKKTTKLKEQEIPSGFNPDDYVVERVWADAEDGVKVPMALVYKKGIKKDGSAPCFLYSYGSYGHSSDVHFSITSYSLINRGFIYAIAQIRGGSDLGEQWYEDGKLLKKKNTFTDFIACAKKLVNDKYTSSEKLCIEGGSAGGLLMGAVTNMAPKLFKAVVAAVPFVDVVTTMLDDSLPLTTGEYEEWGNPNEEEYFNYMLSYSPYDNIEAKEYPNMLVTGGINDSQVLFHEPTKYVAKLRSMKTDNNILILHMDMDSGHGGATGRYEYLKDEAFRQAFFLLCLGMVK